MSKSASRLSFVLLVALLACAPPPTPGNTGTSTDGGSTPDGGPTGPATLATWATDYVDAYCAFAVRCGYVADLPFCDAISGPEFTVATFRSPGADVAAAMAGKSQFNASAATTCLGAISNLSCTMGATPPTGAISPCAGVFTGGTVATGGACISDYECTGTSSCVVSSSTSTCAGTCAPTSATNCSADSDCPTGQYCGGSNACTATVPPGAANSPCGAPTACQAGLACDNSQNPPMCVTPGGAGATCYSQNLPSLTGTCAAGLACVVSDDGTTATCMTPASLGQACTALFQCGAQYLINDIICDEATQKCVPMPSTGPCVVVPTGQNTCNLSTSYCASSGGTGTCQAVLVAGSTCDATTGVNQCAMWSGCEMSGTGSTTTCTSFLTPVCTP